MGEFSYLEYDYQQPYGEGDPPADGAAPLLGYQEEARALVPENVPMLGQILLEQGVVGDAELEAAIARQAETGQAFAQVLLDGEWVAPDQLVEALQIRAGYG